MFHIYVAIVLFGCYVCFAMVFKCFSGIFVSVSYAHFKCFVCLHTYVSNAISRYFKSRSGCFAHVAAARGTRCHAGRRHHVWPGGGIDAASGSGGT
jgi:hypothetical protein